ncbi:hypothetical protein EXS70_05020 [Candidatus Peribacteria bacterium]|nr:hypothetical protein [Candidatus Peribacteria bacterium]
MPRVLRSLTREFTHHRELWIVFVTGVLLRAQYMLSTPLIIRSYDTSGHVNYIIYVLKNWTLPPGTAGWEMHQPPLYYFLTALWMKAKMVVLPSIGTWRSAQWFSVLISALTLWMCLRIARKVFPQPKQQIQALLFLGIMAVLPGIVFFSSRVSNDTLVTFFLFAFTASLLDWWQSGKDKDWYFCLAFLILGILTKLSAGVALPILLTCIWLRPGLHTAKRKHMTEGTLLILFFCTAWSVGLRLQEGFVAPLVKPGLLGLNHALAVPLGIPQLLSFSPIRILMTTYNNPWTDEFGRQFLWEFFFKSAFVGEWQFLGALRPLHQLMLAGGLFTLVLAIFGVVRDTRRKSLYRVPLLLTLGFGLLSVFVFHILHSAGCTQDFRYVPQVAIPIGLYACMGLDALSPEWKKISTITLLTFCILCGIFLLSLSRAWF